MKRRSWIREFEVLRRAAGREVLFVLGLALASGVAGCEAPQGPTTRWAQLVANVRPFESDIPVPTGFRIIEAASEDYRQGGRRLFLRHRYVGAAPKITVRTFYRDQMPLARWTPLRDFTLRGRYTMQFQKLDEFCTLVIDDLEDSSLGTVVVDVCIAPGLTEQADLKRLP